MVTLNNVSRVKVFTVKTLITFSELSFVHFTSYGQSVKQDSSQPQMLLLPHQTSWICDPEGTIFNYLICHVTRIRSKIEYVFPLAMLHVSTNFHKNQMGRFCFLDYMCSRVWVSVRWLTRLSEEKEIPRRWNRMCFVHGPFWCNAGFEEIWMRTIWFQ